MYSVNPSDVERYALRILLSNVRGSTSFESLRTVEGTLWPTFHTAAQAAGFLEDDQYFRNSLIEAAQFQLPTSLRSFFASLLCFCSLANPLALWLEFADALSEDYVHRGHSRQDSIVFAYFDIDDPIRSHGRRFQDFLPAPQDARPDIPEVPLDYDAHAAREMPCMQP